MRLRPLVATTLALASGGIGCSDDEIFPPLFGSTTTTTTSTSTTTTTSDTTSSSSGGGGLGGGGAGGGGSAGAAQGGGGAGGTAAFQLQPGALVPDFSLLDVNVNSLTFAQPVSPRDYLQRVSGWYFGHAT